MSDQHDEAVFKADYKGVLGQKSGGSQGSGQKQGAQNKGSRGGQGSLGVISYFQKGGKK